MHCFIHIQEIYPLRHLCLACANAFMPHRLTLGQFGDHLNQITCGIEMRMHWMRNNLYTNDVDMISRTASILIQVPGNAYTIQTLISFIFIFFFACCKCVCAVLLCIKLNGKERIVACVCWKCCDERAQVQSIRSTRFRLNHKTINEYENPQQYLVEPW